MKYQLDVKCYQPDGQLYEVVTMTIRPKVDRECPDISVSSGARTSENELAVSNVLMDLQLSQDGPKSWSSEIVDFLNRRAPRNRWEITEICELESQL